LKPLLIIFITLCNICGLKAQSSLVNIHDSLFYTTKADTLIAASPSLMEQPLVPLPSVLRNQLTNCFPFNAPVNSAFYYSSWGKKGDITLLVLYVVTMHSYYFALVAVNKDFKITDCLTLTDEHCDLVDQTDAYEEVWCNLLRTYKISQATFKLVAAKYKTRYVPDSLNIEFKTVNKLYTVSNQGTFKIVSADSTIIKGN